MPRKLNYSKKTQQNDISRVFGSIGYLQEKNEDSVWHGVGSFRHGCSRFKVKLIDDDSISSVDQITIVAQLISFSFQAKKKKQKNWTVAG